MAEPLSTDLRKRVVDAVNGGMSRRQAAAHFKVGASSAIRWVAQSLATGDVTPKRQGGDRRSMAIEAQAAFILSLLGPQGDATLAEMRGVLLAAGHSFSISALSRFFARRGVTLKKSLRGLAPHLRRAFSSLRGLPLELKRADEVERRMAADGIVEAVDIAPDCGGPWIPERSATRLREADLNVLSKLGNQGLERRLEPEAFTGGEVGREDDLLDVLVGCPIDIQVARQPST